MNGDWRHTVLGLRVDISLLAITHVRTWNRTWKEDQQFTVMLLRVSGSTLFQGTSFGNFIRLTTSISLFVPRTWNWAQILAAVSIIFDSLYWVWLTRTFSGIHQENSVSYYVLLSLPELEYSCCCFNGLLVVKIVKKRMFCVFL